MQILGEYKLEKCVLYRRIGSHWQRIFRSDNLTDINSAIYAYKFALGK